MAYQIKLLFRLRTEPEDQVSSVDLYTYINPADLQKFPGMKPDVAFSNVPDYH
jgi:hypothetical protein